MTLVETIEVVLDIANGDNNKKSNHMLSATSHIFDKISEHDKVASSADSAVPGDPVTEYNTSKDKKNNFTETEAHQRFYFVTGPQSNCTS